MKQKMTLDPNIEQMLSVYGDEKSALVQDYLDHPEKLPVFMDFRVDYAFKYILGHKPVLLKLINDILPVDVSDIEYLPNEIMVVSPKEKRAVFDVLCTARRTGERFIIEMQCVPDLDMDDRLLFYGCSLIHSQIERGNKTYRLKPVYVLCVANYVRDHGDCVDPGRFFFGYQLREQSIADDVFSRQLQFYFLELPRLQQKWELLKTNVERWCFLFGNLNNFAELPKDPAGFEDVFALAKTGGLDGTELKKYVFSMLDEYTIYTTTEYARQEGYKEGMEKGMEAGMEAGMEKGVVQVARNLLAMDAPLETITQATGLSPETIQSLKHQ